MRKLASIQKIVDISPIDGADKIEIVKVLGWQCVAKKNEFKVGDFCVYFELDSLLPKTKWSEFLFKTTSDTYRLRSVKLKGALSQGLALPLNLFDLPNVNEGDDVTEILNVIKWEPTIPAHLAGQVRGNFPSFISKTDEERIQSSPELFEELKACGQVYGSIKCDGSSATFYNWENVVGACSRNQDLKEDENNSFWRIANKFGLKSSLPNGFAIQGELVGPGVQGNRMGLTELDLYVFNVYDIQNGKYLDYNDFTGFCNSLNLKTVKTVFKGDFTFNSIDEMLEFANQQTYDNGSPAEGIVWRPLVNVFSKKLNGRLSCKTISNKFLLKYNE